MNKYVVPVLTLLSFFIHFFGSGQHVGTCGETILSIKERIIQKENFQKWTRSHTTAAELDELTIPLIFHFLDGTRQTRIGLEAFVAELNDAFANEGRYETPNGVDTKIRFCLASTTPDGGVSAGHNFVETRYDNFDIELESGHFFSHISWDSENYLNVYVAKDIRGENPTATYYNGKDWWTRVGYGGFARPKVGVVILGLSIGTLVHEIGHYFGLLHPFNGFRSAPCKNDDCLLDGDLVCDTPPDASIGGSCDQNSCQTDTLSNFSNGYFFTDVPDMSTNHMDYSSCGSEFSQGQVERMHFIIDSWYPNLPTEYSEINLCNSPCELEEVINVEISTDLIIAGEPLGLSTSGGTFDHYEWYIDDNLVSWNESSEWSGSISTSASYEHTFDTQGWYNIYLRAWNDDNPSCFASFYMNVMVTCGVDARFSPDKRSIASKQPDSLFTDSVIYVNFSDGAIDYLWSVSFYDRITNDLNYTFHSTEQDLSFAFTEPGEYHVQLKASNGSCVDYSNTYIHSIIDPTIDASPVIENLFCLSKDTIGVKLLLYNYGYDTINAGMPISFYSGNPLTNSNSILLGSDTLPSIVYGLNELTGFAVDTFNFQVKTDYMLLDSLFAVVNDTGSASFPISFPPNDKDVLSVNSQFPLSGYAELTYENNLARFLWENDPIPKNDTVLCIGQSVIFEPVLSSDFLRQCLSDISWQSALYGSLGNENRIKYIVTENDTIFYTVVFPDGEVWSDSFLVSVSPPEITIPQSEYTINYGESVRLEVIANDNIDSIYWSPDDYLNNPSILSPTASPLQTTTYRINAFDSINCNVSDTVLVNVIDIGYIPNLFSPNGDGRNDRLLVYGIEGVESFLIKVFNRAGNTVFTSASIDGMKSTGWDGKWNNQEQPSGAYYWSVFGTYLDGVPIRLNGEKSGIIHLIR